VNRLEKHLEELKARHEKSAIFFITAGDPSLKDTLHIMLSMAENGADCIELGVPFSDPIADGPVIQRATLRALKNKITLKDILATVAKFRQRSDVPVVMMGYYNPLLRFGLKEIVAESARAGVDGLIVADLPFEEGEELEVISKREGVSLVYLLAPDIDPGRTRDIIAASSGFIYCVAQYSTTGADDNGDSVSPQTIKSLQNMTRLPIAVGFGISSLAKARQMSETADGIIIGSWLLKELEASENKALFAGQFVKKVKQAIRREQQR